MDRLEKRSTKFRVRSIKFVFNRFGSFHAYRNGCTTFCQKTVPRGTYSRFQSWLCEFFIFFVMLEAFLQVLHWQPSTLESKLTRYYCYCCCLANLSNILLLRASTCLLLKLKLRALQSLCFTACSPKNLTQSRLVNRAYDKLNFSSKHIQLV